MRTSAKRENIKRRYDIKRNRSEMKNTITELKNTLDVTEVFPGQVKNLEVT